MWASVIAAAASLVVALVSAGLSRRAQREVAGLTHRFEEQRTGATCARTSAPPRGSRHCTAPSAGGRYRPAPTATPGWTDPAALRPGLRSDTPLAIARELGHPDVAAILSGS